MITRKKGEELKKKIEKYRESMIEMIEDPTDYAGLIDAIEGNLNTNDHEAGKKGDEFEPWESHNFEHLPLAAVMTILSEMQAAVRNVESDVIGYLLEQVDAKDFKVNVIDAIVLPKSNVVFPGQEYSASVFLAAYDSTKIPKVVLDNGTILEVQSGKGLYKATSTAAKDYTWGGVLTLDNDGQLIERNFTATYRVTAANAVISPTKMNVFYRGVANPVSISASGVTEAAVTADITSGEIKKDSPGNYFVYPGPKADNCKVKVYANVDGSRSFMGEAPFRVLDLPDPTAKVGGQTGGYMTLSKLTRLKSVDAVAENFLFDVEFTVISFSVNVVGSGGINIIEESKSENFTSKQQEILRRMRSGQRVFIEDIQATGPDGRLRTLNNLTIKIQ
jgi:gliding motility-associated protein GldM